MHVHTEHKLCQEINRDANWNHPDINNQTCEAKALIGIGWSKLVREMSRYPIYFKTPNTNKYKIKATRLLSIFNFLKQHIHLKFRHVTGPA